MEAVKHGLIVKFVSFGRVSRHASELIGNTGLCVARVLLSGSDVSTLLDSDGLVGMEQVETGVDCDVIENGQVFRLSHKDGKIF